MYIYIYIYIYILLVGPAQHRVLQEGPEEALQPARLGAPRLIYVSNYTDMYIYIYIYVYIVTHI